MASPPLPSSPKSAILTRQNGKWHIVFHVENEAQERERNSSVGLDLGLSRLLRSYWWIIRTPGPAAGR
jgi:hypothetical protein